MSGATVIGISPKLIAAISVPLSAVVSKVIISGDIDRVSIAAIATLLIGAVASYLAPVGTVAPDPAFIDTRLTPDEPDEVDEP